MKIVNLLSHSPLVNFGIAILLGLMLASCGGSSSTSKAQMQPQSTTPPPLIQSMILSFPPGSAPANQPTAMVSITNPTTNVSITNATVTVNGVALTYNPIPTHDEYEGMVTVNPGLPVTMVVQVGGKTYTANSTQITTYPVITSPIAGATLVAGDTNNISWTSGAPFAGASNFLVVGEAADPVGGLIYIRSLLNTVTNLPIPSGSLPMAGSADVIVGLTIPVQIPNADPASFMEVGGHSYVPVTIIPIAAPTSVQSTSGDKQVTVSWTPDANATSYNIYWSNTAANANKVSGTKIANVTTPYIHTNLNNGATYYYTVTAVSAKGEGPESAVVSGAPMAIVNPTVVAGSAQTTINWPSVVGATSYNLYWSTTAANATKLAGNKIAGVTNPYTHTLLTNGIPYYYTVTSVYPSGEGVASAVVRAIPGTRIMGGSVQGFPLVLTNTVSTVADSIANAWAYPVGMTTDGINLYFVDGSNNVIKKLDLSTGAISVFAGVLPSACGSTDGVASLAHFCSPRGIATDGTNLYVADTGNGTIRKIVIASGMVSTLAGTAGTAGLLPFDGIGAAAIFNSPDSITTDGTNLYVTEKNGNKIRKIVIANATVSTLATVGSGITTDGANLYIADGVNQTISKMVISTGIISNVAGAAGVIGSADGAGTLASFNGPNAITTDGTNLYVTDTFNETIRKIVISSGLVTTLAGLPGVNGTADGVGSLAKFFNPLGITTDGVNLFVSDSSNGKVKKIQ